MREREWKNRISTSSRATSRRRAPREPGVLPGPASKLACWLAIAILALELGTAGCGDFWQNPNGTGNSSGTATTTDLTASSDTATVGTSLTLTATVTPSEATGTVTFYNNSTSIGTGALSSGTANLTTSFSTTGTDSLTASYGGDSTYASSTSSAVTVTVTAASPGSAIERRATAEMGPASATDAGPAKTVSTSAYEAAPIHATSSFAASGGTYVAKDAEAVAVEGKGRVALTDATLNGAGGTGRGILLERDSRGGPSHASFTMTGGTLSYECDAAATPACADGSSVSGRSVPAALFAIDNAKAEISLTDVSVRDDTPTEENRDGTLLKVMTPKTEQGAGANGGSVAFRAEGTAMRGDVIPDGGMAALTIVSDDHGRGSSLTGAIDRDHSARDNPARDNSAPDNSANAVTLTLDAASLWTVTGTSHLASLEGLDLNGTTVGNINGGGHCVFYSGAVNGAGEQKIYALSGGGYLAPEGTTGLACE